MQNACIRIDLAAARHNLALLRQAAPKARVLAVIKANAYGHGLLRMARALEAADAFAVARLDEALSLRHAGIRQRVVVLQGFVAAEELDLMYEHDLEPVIHSGFQVDRLEQVVYARPIRVWIKLDTGMHRLGFLPAEFADYYAKLSRCRSVASPLSLMTHFARADEIERPETGQQWQLFQRLLQDARDELSVANSAGILNWQETHVDWIRPGIVLYGVSPFADGQAETQGLKPVMCFQTRLIAIKEIQTGAAVGYGGDWVAQRPTRMGIAACGYGDGYPRRAASGTPVLVAGQRVPLMGRVSMDMINLDLTDCPDAQVGDEVTLWGGGGLAVEEIARQAGTIPYDLLCGITQRVLRLETDETGR